MSTRRDFLHGMSGCAFFPTGDDDMNDTDQMLINDARRLARAVEIRKTQIVELEKRVKARSVSRLAKRPKRYSVEVAFDSTEGNNTQSGLPPAKEESFVIDGNTVFFCAQIETSVRIVAQAGVENEIGAPVPGQIANLTRPYGVSSGSRNNLLDFFWRIRDTDSDREWQNMEMPDPFLLSGSLSGLRLPVLAQLKGGTHVAVEIEPTRFVVNDVSTFTSTQKMVVHISFDGHEVRL